VKRAIDKLRSLIRDQKYLISIHANKEMSNDELTAMDVENAILTGGTRYEVIGKSCDDRAIAVVCRDSGAGWLRIITVYALDIQNHDTRNM